MVGSGSGSDVTVPAGVCVGSGSGTAAALPVGVSAGAADDVGVSCGTAARIASPRTVGAPVEGVGAGNLSAVRPVTLVPAVAVQPSASAYAAPIANGTSAIAVATVEITTRRQVTGAVKTVQSGRHAAELATATNVHCGRPCPQLPVPAPGTRQQV